MNKVYGILGGAALLLVPAVGHSQAAWQGGNDPRRQPWNNSGAAASRAPAPFANIGPPPLGQFPGNSGNSQMQSGGQGSQSTWQDGSSPRSYSSPSGSSQAGAPSTANTGPPPLGQFPSSSGNNEMQSGGQGSQSTWQGGSGPRSYSNPNGRSAQPRRDAANGGQPVGPGTPSGGCWKYGAAGALAGHAANHGVLGAVGGCATGMWVKHRSKQRYRETGHY